MTRVEERLRFARDGTVTALSGKVDYGQGLRAAYPRIVAEELRVPLAHIRVVLGDTDLTPWDMGTFGSLSVEMDGRELRRAAAFARHVLLARAAGRWGCSERELELAEGVVRRAGTGDAIPIGDLVADAGVTGPIPDDVLLAAPAPSGAEGPDAAGLADFVTGRAAFVADVRLPGMVHGAVLHPAVHGATLRQLDRAAALAVPGVLAVVQEPGFAGVVAERHAQALAGCAALAPVWERGTAPANDATQVALRGDPGALAALAAGPTRVERYFTPHVAGAPIGPSVGVADVRADGAVIYASTQVPFRLRDQVARIAGVAPERVHVRPRAMSGGFGRHGASDAGIEAARLSKAVGRPVRVQWGRADELRAGPNRPEMTAELQAVLSASGTIRAWRSEVWTNPYSYDVPTGERPSREGAGAPGGGWGAPDQMAAGMAGRNAVPPYDVGLAEVTLHVVPGRVRTGALRSLGAAPNVFAIESFMDELARTAGRDPLEFRLAHTRDPRLRRVLEAVAERSGWRGPRGERGLGIACTVYRQTYVAEVVEASVEAGGAIAVERVWCAVDPGHVVHPNGARNQIEGAVQMGISWTLFEELPHQGDEVTGSTWEHYPIATARDAPRAIDIVFTGDDATASSGLGEPPVVPVAPAIANAVAAACGARLRRLPMRPAAVLAAIAVGGGPTSRPRGG